MADGRQFSLWREDLIASLCALAVIAGLFVDGWNHINLQDGALGGFFTPWHGLLYAGFTLTAAWVVTRNPHLYRRRIAPKSELHRVAGVPLRYPLAMLGLAIANLGLAGDIGWHAAFGEETGVARVIAPFHLILFFGAALIISAPLRSGWHTPEVYPSNGSLVTLLPPLLSLALLTALIAFMLQWLSAFVDWSPSLQPGDVPAALAVDPVLGTVEFGAAARILVTNIVLLAPMFLVMRRWHLPFGAVTLTWAGVAAGLAALTEFRSGGVVLGAVAGGVVADLLIAAGRRSGRTVLYYRLLGGVAPLALWLAYFAVVAVLDYATWPADLWLGVVGAASMTGAALSFLVVPIALPQPATTYAVPAQSAHKPIRSKR